MNKVNARLRYGLLQGTAVIAPVALAAALMPLRGHISTTNVALLMVVAVAPVAFGSRVAGIASTAEVEVRIDNEALCVHVRDNGTGGADPARGSGIVGLRDRVEALGGRLMLASPRGQGTSMLAEFPLGAPGSGGSEGPAGSATPPQAAKDHSTLDGPLHPR